MLTSILIALAIAGSAPAVTVEQITVHPPQIAQWLDPIDEVAPWVCEHHGRVYGAMARGYTGVAWCEDGTLQRFTIS